MTFELQFIKGGVTAASGFKAAGAHIGLRRKRKDLAILSSELPCDWAATFTTNSVKAAPVLWNQQLLAGKTKVSAIVINSAIANSCTGLAGQNHARQMAETTADCLGLDATSVLVASTGVIGVHLPIKEVAKGIRETAPLLSATYEAGCHAADAITTTDTYVKQYALQVTIDDKEVIIGAMAKGSGMVHPNMATMLAFITTDLNIDPTLLQKALSESVSKTFNMISVDGDNSTNDMVVAMANGAAGNARIDNVGDAYQQFANALDVLTCHLAKLIAGDGEGASKLLEVQVSGALTVTDARKLARAVVCSSLVKVALFAEDANWGRVVAAMGSSGVNFDCDKLALSLSCDQHELGLLVDGMPYWVDEVECKSILSGKSVTLKVEITEGNCSATAWGCDLTPEYIRKSGNYQAGQRTEKTLTGMYAQGGAA